MNRLRQFFEHIIDSVLPKDAVSTFDAALFDASAAPRDVYPSMIAVFPYKESHIRKTIWALKYRGNVFAATLLAPHMASVVFDAITDMTTAPDLPPPLLIPMPRAASHVRKRGANQAELLGKAIYEKTGKSTLTYAPDILRRKESESQIHTKGRSERFKNVAGMFFVVDPSRIRGKNIFLIDDVVTTGATMNEARLALLKAGASSVLCIAAAH